MKLSLLLATIISIAATVLTLTGCASSLKLGNPNMGYSRGGLGSENPSEVAAAGATLEQSAIQADLANHRMTLETNESRLRNREENEVVDALHEALKEQKFREEYLRERQRHEFWSPYNYSMPIPGMPGMPYTGRPDVSRFYSR